MEYPRYAVALVALFAAAGCAGRSMSALPIAPSALGGASARHSVKGGNPISHVVVIVQENRTVDNLFHGFPGADTVSYGPDSHGQRVALIPQPLDSPWDATHTHGAFATEYANGAMDGFDRVSVQSLGGKKYPGTDFVYAYVPQDQVQPYWDMATQYALSDETFQSNSGPSFPGHLYLIAGQSANVIGNPSKMPWGCDGPANENVAWIDPLTGQNIYPNLWPCLTPAQMPVTLADELDKAGISWRYYAPVEHSNFGENWSIFDAVQAVRYGPDWSNVIAPETTVLSDIANGKLAGVTFVVPSAKNSDHDGLDTLNGPNWVASVVNAVGASPFWQSTAIVVVWDDWGGWYDHVIPRQFDYEGLGFRVPLIAISPYAKTGYVSHALFETASVPKFVEKVFGLASMSIADGRATSLDDLFDFKKKPSRLRFRPIRLTQPLSNVLSDSRTSTLPPDGGLGEDGD